ncbi:MAG: DHHA1 domain-containing protein [Thermosphaera sp.]
MKELLITHTDMDGVASAGLYIYLNRPSYYHVLYTEPYLMNKAVKKALEIGCDKLAVFDIGINPVVYDEVLEAIGLLARKGVAIEWYDHHVWEEKWKEGLTLRGAHLYIDRSTCGVGVVARNLSPTAEGSVDYLKNMVDGVCGGDLWRFDHWLSPFYIRLVRRRDPIAWKNKVVETISKGVYWNDEFSLKVLKELEGELTALSNVSINPDTKIIKVNNFKVGIRLIDDDVENSFLASLLLSRANLDVVVIASRDGKLSIRSRSVNVRDLAVALNGGGHTRAAGAKVNIPVTVRLLSRLTPRVFTEYIAKLVEANAEYLKRLED